MISFPASPQLSDKSPVADRISIRIFPPIKSHANHQLMQCSRRHTASSMPSLESGNAYHAFMLMSLWYFWSRLLFFFAALARRYFPDYLMPISHYSKPLQLSRFRPSLMYFVCHAAAHYHFRLPQFFLSFMQLPPKWQLKSFVDNRSRASRAARFETPFENISFKRAFYPSSIIYFIHLPALSFSLILSHAPLPLVTLPTHYILTRREFDKLAFHRHATTTLSSPNCL